VWSAHTFPPFLSFVKRRKSKENQTNLIFPYRFHQHAGVLINYRNVNCTCVEGSRLRCLGSFTGRFAAFFFSKHLHFTHDLLSALLIHLNKCVCVCFPFLSPSLSSLPALPLLHITCSLLPPVGVRANTSFTKMEQRSFSPLSLSRQSLLLNFCCDEYCSLAHRFH
jgi:hypothetical protein